MSKAIYVGRVVGVRPDVYKDKRTSADVRSTIVQLLQSDAYASLVNCSFPENFSLKNDDAIAFSGRAQNNVWNGRVFETVRYIEDDPFNFEGPVAMYKKLMGIYPLKK